ncbi:MAG: N-acetylmannosamine-6-phosphate 2-epimerase [Oscillospiraceae bacterium]
MNNLDVFKQIKGGLIVSCQALEEEPLHSSFIMGRMAYAAKLGGAAGIRANSVEDITEMKKLIDLPIIGIIKKDFDDSNVRITPTINEIDALVEICVEIIATDATNRTRPNGATLDEFFKVVRKKYPNQLFMADCSTYEEAIHAQEIGFDYVGTTLRGYTDYTKGIQIPDFDLLKKMATELNTPVIAEGGIWSPEQLKSALACGVHSAVVGTAITRPMDITKRYVDAIK